MFVYLQKIYELKDDNEYRKNRDLKNQRFYDDKERTERYVRRKIDIRSDDIENVDGVTAQDDE